MLQNYLRRLHNTITSRKYINCEELVFRYDNASHHPYIFTYPHHKHVGSAVEPSPNPDLGDVLSEIEKLMWAE